jgi:uncharacterized protein
MRHTTLLTAIVRFCRYLRQEGFGVNVADETLALEALNKVDLGIKKEFRLALKAILVKSIHDLQKFDSLYDNFWKELEKEPDSKIVKSQEQRPRPRSNQESFNSLKSWLYGNKTDEEASIASYSVGESLSQKDFSKIPADELEELRKRIKEIAQTLAKSASRRQQKTQKAKTFDARRTVRQNLRRGGELLHLAFQKPQKNRIRLVVLADVSKSMELYSSFLIQFLYAFQSVYKRIETFVFSSKLERVTHQLRNQNFETALSQLSVHVVSWSGGTQIGSCLEFFVEQYSNMIDSQTVVLILSDGWDAGEPEKIAESMAKIAHKSRKIIWLNPLAGNPTYQPSTEGMKAAMPYIDVFGAAHNAESLSKLGQVLK